MRRSLRWIAALAALLCAPLSAADRIGLWTDPVAPTPGIVNLFLRWAVDVGGARPPLVPSITLLQVAPVAGTPRDIAGTAWDANNLQFWLGPLDVGRYRAVYRDGTGAGATPQAELEFEVTATGLATVVEYYNSTLDRYFITADAAEIAALDGGTISGWSRTGESFHVLPADALPSDAHPVCRYYGRPQAGLDTHFYSDDPAECEAVARNWPDRWILESDRAFGIEGAWRWYDYFCEDTHRPLYRLYNDRPQVNHRYTVNMQVRDQMLALGWVLEARYAAGYAYAGAYTTCVPIAPTSP